MSVKVDLDQLADFAFAYLVTVGDDDRAHTMAVEPVLGTEIPTYTDVPIGIEATGAGSDFGFAGA